MEVLGNILDKIDSFVWGVPLIVLILAVGIYLSIRLGFLQIRHLPKALKFMFQNEEEGHGEVSSFGALCTALSATIGTGNIVGVATAIGVLAGGPGALFWMWLAALFGMATKYAEGFLAVKYRTIDKEGHVLGGPFYYIENGMGPKWKWLAKLFAFFGACVGLFGIGTFTQVNGIASAVQGFFDPNKENFYLWKRILHRYCDHGYCAGSVCRTGSYWWYPAYFQSIPGNCAVYGSYLYSGSLGIDLC